MEANELKAIVEALIFVSEEPITERGLLDVLGEAGVAEPDLLAAIDTIRQTSTNDPSSGLQLTEVAGGFQFRTKESCAQWIQKLNTPKPVRLSQPALETLAIIAYRQPIVRSEIEQIRGVDVGATLKTLLERNLIRIIGRKDEPGQPLIYGTTRDFLETFNLKNLHELPTLADIEDIARRQVETETPLTVVKGADEDEPTEIIEDEEEEDDEEETEIVPKDEDEDEEAMIRLEKGLKDLRRLEREVFPKPPQATEEGNVPEGQVSSAEGDTADAPPEDDRTGN